LASAKDALFAAAVFFASSALAASVASREERPRFRNCGFSLSILSYRRKISASSTVEIGLPDLSAAIISLRRFVSNFYCFSNPARIAFVVSSTCLEDADESLTEGSSAQTRFYNPMAVKQAKTQAYFIESPLFAFEFLTENLICICVEFDELRDRTQKSVALNVLACSHALLRHVATSYALEPSDKTDIVMVCGFWEGLIFPCSRRNRDGFPIAE